MSALRTEVEKCTEAFHQALRSDYAAGLFSYVADDVVMMPPHEAPLRGITAMRLWYDGFLAAFRTTKLILSDREVWVGDNWATELGRYEWGLRPVSGGEPVVDQGSYMQVWERRANGHWLFAREIWNSALPLSSAGG